jgi:extradiol dioxygenase family protein
MDRDGISNPYRGPSIDASYQVSDHLTKPFQRKRFLEIDQSKTRIACVGHVFLMDRDEMSNRNRGPPIDASYKVSVHLAKQFKRRRYSKIDQSETRIACGGHVC